MTAPAAQQQEWAGRSLDTEIARVVFGHEVERVKRWVIVMNQRHHEEDVDQVVGTLNMLPRYSRNIADAWLVFDRLVEAGLQVLVARDPGDPYEVEVCVTEALYEQGYRGCVIEDDSAPRAICRAALRSLAALGTRDSSEVDGGE